MTKYSRVESLVVSLRKSKRQGKDSLPAAKRRALVREFGIDAVRALLIAEHPKWEAEVFELGAEGSPWPYAGLSAREVATRALGPLADRLPRTIGKLASAELVVVAHHVPESDSPDLGGWFLIYALPEEHGPELWIAGAPEPAPELAIDGWDLPAPLRELYAQHHGLGVLCDEFGWTGVDPGIQPTPQLSIPSLPELDGDEDAPDPTDLLRFTRGTGEAGESGWCIVRNRKLRKGRSKPGDLAICELDDQFGLLGNPVPFDFWGFLDRYLVGDPNGELPTAEHY
ncbi:hypothetical protein ACNOYE_15320 [Nannocystaceae bacterium ST9]